MPRLRLTRRDTLDLDEATGVLVLGAPGTGKTTTTGAALCRALLADPATGILFLVAHEAELNRLKSYIHDAGRDRDLVLFSRHAFNPLQWGLQLGYGVEQLTGLVMQALEVHGRLGGEHDNRYWLAAMQGAVRSAIRLLTLAQDTLSLHDIHRILTSTTPRSPLEGEQARQERSSPSSRGGKTGKGKPSHLTHLLTQARRRIAEHADSHAAHDLRMVEAFFTYWSRDLNPRVRSTVVSVYEAFVNPFLYGELYERVCGGVTLDPRWTHRGKLILMDIPAEQSEAYALLQVLMKSAWQLATRRRRLARTSGLTVCYADEAALFLHPNDGDFLAVARNRRASLVYLGHGIAEFTARLGREATMDVCAQFGTKILHATTDPETLRYACEGMIGETWQQRVTETETRQRSTSSAFGWLWRLPLRLLGRVTHRTRGESRGTIDRLAPQLLTHELATLRTGGHPNRYRVDALLVQTGRKFSTGHHFLRVTLQQDFAWRWRRFQCTFPSRWNKRLKTEV